MSSIEISPLKLSLDHLNPRFVIPPDASQDAIRRKLLNREDIVALAKQIVNVKGLYPGERVVVYPEGAGHVVVEGNRRICACQLLLDRALIPESHRTSFPIADAATIAEISTIAVDVIADRGTAAGFLASRHIDGPQKWSPLSKMLFFARPHLKGKSPEQISRETKMRPGEVRGDIRDYNLIQYAFDLPCWTDEERKRLNWESIETTPFLRLFKIKGAMKRVGLKYGSDLSIQPACNRRDFDRTVELIARATFASQDDAAKVSTRETLDDVPGLPEHLLSISCGPARLPGLSVQPSGQQAMPPVPDGKPTSAPPAANDQARDSEVVEVPCGGESARGTDRAGHDHSPHVPAQRQGATLKEHDPNPPAAIATPTNAPTRPQVAPLPKPYKFFEGIESTLSQSDNECNGILKVADEIRRFPYDKYPIAAAMLLRSLFEQALKYHIRTKNHAVWQKLQRRDGKDPTLDTLITRASEDNALQELFPGKYQRPAQSVLLNPGVKALLDLNAHQTGVVTATPQILEGLAGCGLRDLIQYMITPGKP